MILTQPNARSYPESGTMAIRYNVSMLLREGIGATRDYEVANRVLIDEDEPRHEEVIGRATLLRTEQGVLVTAHLQGVERGLCSRCLQGMEISLRMEIEEEFIVIADAETDDGVSPPEDSEAFQIDARHTLDLEEAVRQHWAAAVPMQPLCRSDCRGLCPRCGHDLNQGACSCPPEEDERWSALRQLAGNIEGS